MELKNFKAKVLGAQRCETWECWSLSLSRSISHS